MCAHPPWMGALCRFATTTKACPILILELQFIESRAQPGYHFVMCIAATNLAVQTPLSAAGRQQEERSYPTTHPINAAKESVVHPKDHLPLCCRLFAITIDRSWCTIIIIMCENAARFWLVSALSSSSSYKETMSRLLSGPDDLCSVASSSPLPRHMFPMKSNRISMNVCTW